MEIAIIESIVSNNGFNYSDIMSRWCVWLNKGEYTPNGVVFDVGRTCLRACRNFMNSVEAELQQKVDIINQQTAKQKMIIEAEGKTEKRKTEGCTYQEERSYDVAEKVAENEGAGNFSSADIGMGIMSSVGNAVNNTFGTAMTNMENNGEKYCDNCGNKIENNQNFCDNCGQEINKNQVCKYCSYKFTKQGKFCPNCGKERS